MEARRILIDTSILIEYFRKIDKSKSLIYKILYSDDELCISSITEFEFLCGCKTLERIHEAKELLDSFTKLSFNSEHGLCSSEIYNELRSTNQMIDIVDILLAGVARSEAIPMITLNEKHFSRISGLDLLRLEQS